VPREFGDRCPPDAGPGAGYHDYLAHCAAPQRHDNGGGNKVFPTKEECSFLKKRTKKLLLCGVPDLASLHTNA
jgi:hypothetical protein